MAMKQSCWKDLLVWLFAASVYLVAFVVDAPPRNDAKLLNFGLLAALYFLLRGVWSLLKERKGAAVMNTVCLIIIVSGIYEAGLGLLQLYGKAQSLHALFPTTGTFFNPGPFAGYLAIVLPLALYFLLNPLVQNRSLSAVIRLLSLTAAVCIVLALPASMSRASWLAAAAGCAVVLLGNRKCERFRGLFSKRLLLPLVLAVVLIFTGIYFLKKDSADGRFFAWKMELKTVVKNPLGVGLGNFSGACGDTQAAYFASGQGGVQEKNIAGNMQYAFNEFLQISVENGLVALALFVAVIAFSFPVLLRRQGGMAGALTALLVFSFFSYPFCFWQFLAVLVFLISVPDVENGKGLKSTGNGILIAISAAIGLTLFAKQLPYFRAKTAWETERVLYGSQLYPEVVERYAPYYPQLNGNTDFLFEYARSLSKTGAYEKSNAVLLRAVKISADPMIYNIMGKNYQAKRQYGDASICFRKAANLMPSLMYPYYLLALLYEETGEQQKASEAAAAFLAKKAKVESTATKEMREKMKELLEN